MTVGADPAAFQCLPAAGVINQYASHHGRTHPDKVCSTLPIPRLITYNRIYASFTSAVGCSVWFGPFVPQLLPCQFPQFVQDQGNQPLNRTRVATTDLLQEYGYFSRRSGLNDRSLHIPIRIPQYVSIMNGY